ncbi:MULTISPECIES: helix-turn-helix transcriptional regulator [Paraburkholderia]|uniref:helix-turn-helix transcriptional regulator n=1 Tax=Paraburkholderia TaxID=1822464 RepID=UPI00036852DF|nr:MULTISPECIES: helix-turn-helix transcriptional regulator [Paraburkholderia]MDH6150500.1 transcriptional regulator with XRE-family HTH domain [Paraburkholderia sp. WSM4179]
MNQVEQQVTRHGRPRKPRILQSAQAREEARIAREDAQREAELKTPLTRFVRNRSTPAELEDLRYRLIRARVENGFSIAEAAARLCEAGAAKSVSLAKIESGKCPTPKDWRFLKQAADAYSISVDWLLGLSPVTALDPKASMSIALLRGTEGVVTGILSQFVGALERTAQALEITPAEVSDLIDAIDGAAARFEKFSAQDAFEDMPGGAPVVAALQRLTQSVASLRRVHGKFVETEKLFAALRAGKLTPIPWLTDDCDTPE